MSTISVFVALAGCQPVIIDISPDAFVGHLIDAAITKLKLDVTADMVTLRLVPNGAGVPGVALDPRNTLSDAGVGARSELVIEGIRGTAVGACIKGNYHYVCLRRGSPLEGAIMAA